MSRERSGMSTLSRALDPGVPKQAPKTGAEHSSLVTHHSSPLLLFEHVSKWSGTGLAVNGVRRELPGGIPGLVGATGAGKRTVLRMANGRLKPTLGRVSVHGTDAWDWRARRLVGYCPDVDAFYEDLSGR